MSIFPYIEIEGTSYEIGYQEGENFREQIQGSIACYKKCLWTIQAWSGAGQRNFPENLSK